MSSQVAPHVCYDNFEGFKFMNDNLSAKIMKFMSSKNICTYNSLLIWIDQTQTLTPIINTATPMDIVTCTWNYSTHVHACAHIHTCKDTCAQTHTYKWTHMRTDTHIHVQTDWHTRGDYNGQPLVEICTKLEIAEQLDIYAFGKLPNLRNLARHAYTEFQCKETSANNN